MGRWERRDRREAEDCTAWCNACGRKNKSTRVWVTANNSYREGQLWDRWTSPTWWAKEKCTDCVARTGCWKCGKMKCGSRCVERLFLYAASTNPAEIRSLQISWKAMKVNMWSSRKAAVACVATCQSVLTHCKWRPCDAAVSMWLWSSGWTFTPGVSGTTHAQERPVKIPLS